MSAVAVKVSESRGPHGPLQRSSERAAFLAARGCRRQCETSWVFTAQFDLRTSSTASASTAGSRWSPAPRPASVALARGPRRPVRAWCSTPRCAAPPRRATRCAARAWRPRPAASTSPTAPRWMRWWTRSSASSGHRDPVNNAGIQRRALRRFAAADWDEPMRTNLDAVFHAAQAVAGRIQPGGRPHHQHLLGDERARPARYRALHRQQGRGEDAHLRAWRSTSAPRASPSTASARAISKTELNRKLIDDVRLQRLAGRPHAAAALGRGGGARRRGGISRQRCGALRQRPSPLRRRRLTASVDAARSVGVPVGAVAFDVDAGLDERLAVVRPRVMRGLDRM